MLKEAQERNEQLHRNKFMGQRPSEQGSLPTQASAGFSKDYEMARRDLDRSIQELFFYLNKHFSNKPNTPFAKHTMDQIMSLMGQSAAFSDIDQADERRRKQLRAVSDELQAHLERLQNPQDCSTAKALVCTLNKGCGFGCQLHHVTYCFIVAYGTNRTLVLMNDGQLWNYSPQGWDAAFKPISSCRHKDVSQSPGHDDKWSSMELSAPRRVVHLPIVDVLEGRPAFLPRAFPKAIAHQLLTLHSNPFVFFVSQFMRYLMRPTPLMASKLASTAASIPFHNGTVVGLQIRRTDKIGTEAAFHPLDEYMRWTEYWYRTEEYRRGTSIKRRVYIATDEPSIFAEARNSYPHYEVYGDAAISKSAQTDKRYSMESLFGVVTDIEMLARCDYLVCTFSSQVCRMGYELMQMRVGDAGNAFHSLDDHYYYGGQTVHEQVVVEAYKSENANEMSLQVGDEIVVMGNHWDGFSKGTNRRTGQTALYPSYKVREKHHIVAFP